jgi:hypothetical protein
MLKCGVYAGKKLPMQFRPDECLPGRCVVRAETAYFHEDLQ